jgi:hypothetical protein
LAMALGFSARPPTSSIDAAEGASADARARFGAGGMTEFCAFTEEFVPGMNIQTWDGMASFTANVYSSTPKRQCAVTMPGFLGLCLPLVLRGIVPLDGTEQALAVNYERGDLPGSRPAPPGPAPTSSSELCVVSHGTGPLYGNSSIGACRRISNATVTS